MRSFYLWRWRELRDRFCLIRAQWPNALVLVVFNMAVLALGAFPGKNG